jgi:hypothetical protein
MHRHHFQNISGANNSVVSAMPAGSGSSAEASVNQAALQLGELPMVALMFLTRGELPHERTWRLFLESLPLNGGHF